MEPVTTAIIAALSTIAGGAGQAVGQNLVTESYEELKATLKRRFSDDSEIVKSVENLESKPDSFGRKQTLEEEVHSSRANQDPEVLKAAQELLDQLESQPGGERHIQSAIGSYIAQADHGSTAEIRINQPEE